MVDPKVINFEVKNRGFLGLFIIHTVNDIQFWAVNVFNPKVKFSEFYLLHGIDISMSVKESNNASFPVNLDRYFHMNGSEDVIIRLYGDVSILDYSNK